MTSQVFVTPDDYDQYDVPESPVGEDGVTRIDGLPHPPQGTRWKIKNTCIDQKKMHLQEYKRFLWFSWWSSVETDWIHENLFGNDWRPAVVDAAKRCLRNYKRSRNGCPKGIVVP